jgi:hypothetical protein
MVYIHFIFLLLIWIFQAIPIAGREAPEGKRGYVWGDETPDSTSNDNSLKRQKLHHTTEAVDIQNQAIATFESEDSTHVKASSSQPSTKRSQDSFSTQKYDYFVMDFNTLTSDQKIRFGDIKTYYDSLNKDYSSPIVVYQFVYYHLTKGMLPNQISLLLKLEPAVIDGCLSILRKYKILASDITAIVYGAPSEAELKLLSSDQRARYNTIDSKLNDIKKIYSVAKVTYQRIFYLVMTGISVSDIIDITKKDHKTVTRCISTLRKLCILPSEESNNSNN